MGCQCTKTNWAIFTLLKINAGKMLSFQQKEKNRTTNLRVVFTLQNFSKNLTLQKKIVWLNENRTILNAWILRRFLHNTTKSWDYAKHYENVQILDMVPSIPSGVHWIVSSVDNMRSTEWKRQSYGFRHIYWFINFILYSDLVWIMTRRKINDNEDLEAKSY